MKTLHFSLHIFVKTVLLRVLIKTVASGYANVWLRGKQMNVYSGYMSKQFTARVPAGTQAKHFTACQQYVFALPVSCC